MRFDPLLPGSWPLVIAVALVMAALLWWSAHWAFSALADPGARASWWRRACLALVMVLILAGPAAAVTESTQVSNVEIYLVVDRTGSMAAEDWAGGPAAGGGTRLDGVKSDLTAIRDAWPQARFCILALDGAAARELPLTSDLDAVTSWIGSLQQEITQRSQGSSLDGMLPLLVQTLTRAKEKNPEDARLVYILSDGEATDDGRGAGAAGTAGATWAEAGELTDGGAVLGYGTASGGMMRSFDGSSTPGSGKYILDPDTGKPAVSVPDTRALASVAEALGVPYFQRTGGSDDVPTGDFTRQDVNAVLTDGREKKNRVRYLTWPLGIAASALAIWELVALIRAERALRRLTALGEGVR
mgnify:FL=1